MRVVQILFIFLSLRSYAHENHSCRVQKPNWNVLLTFNQKPDIKIESTAESKIAVCSLKLLTNSDGEASVNGLSRATFEIQNCGDSQAWIDQKLLPKLHLIYDSGRGGQDGQLQWLKGSQPDKCIRVKDAPAQKLK